MILDMQPILSGETDRICFQDVCDPSDLPSLTPALSDLIFDGPLPVSGTIQNHSGYMVLSMTVSVAYTTHCARCLKELKLNAEYSLEKNVAVKGTLQNEDDSDYLIVEASCLDLNPAVEEVLFLQLPQRHYCREDCKGLCPKCGKDLNEGICGCPTKEPDPRLAVLKQLLR